VVIEAVREVHVIPSGDVTHLLACPTTTNKLEERVMACGKPVIAPHAVRKLPCVVHVTPVGDVAALTEGPATLPTAQNTPAPNATPFRVPVAAKAVVKLA
jgi:hypothetical protein